MEERIFKDFLTDKDKFTIFSVDELSRMILLVQQMIKASNQ